MSTKQYLFSLIVQRISIDALNNHGFSFVSSPADRESKIHSRLRFLQVTAPQSC
jgi:hypothetical protein